MRPVQKVTSGYIIAVQTENTVSYSVDDVHHAWPTKISSALLKRRTYSFHRNNFNATLWLCDCMEDVWKCSGCLCNTNIDYESGKLIMFVEVKRHLQTATSNLWDETNVSYFVSAKVVPLFNVSSYPMLLFTQQGCSMAFIVALHWCDEIPWFVRCIENWTIYSKINLIILFQILKYKSTYNIHIFCAKYARS